MFISTVDNLYTGIVFDPRSKALVTSNMPGVLQFYLPQSDHHAFSVSMPGSHHKINITIEFTCMFAGINMFMPKNKNSVTINITLEDIEKIKIEKITTKQPEHSREQLQVEWLLFYPQ